MKKTSQKQLDYRKRQRDNKNSSYHLNRAKGVKGWTNGIFEDLHIDFHSNRFYKLKISLWEKKLYRLLHSVRSIDHRRITSDKKRTNEIKEIAYERWKKIKSNIRKWSNVKETEFLFHYMIYRCQKSYLARIKYNTQNIWEKKFNSLDAFNKNHIQRYIN